MTTPFLVSQGIEFGWRAHSPGLSPNIGMMTDLLHSHYISVILKKCWRL